MGQPDKTIQQRERMDGEGMKIITIKVDENETSIELDGIESTLEAIGLLETAKFLLMSEEKLTGPSVEGSDTVR